MRSAWRSFWLIASALAASLGGRGDARAADDAGDMGPEILHMPRLERRADQGILRPVPIEVELPREVALRARRVLVHYRLWGDPDWTTLELRRNATRYEGAIPCLEISTVTGDLRYYIRIHDAEGHVIATAASRASPYLVTIKHDTTLDPDQPRVAKCPDPADCPRGLPGCPSERVIEVACKADADCEGGMTCSWRGVCERAARRGSWLSVSIQQELGVVPTTGACSIQMQENEGYACIRDDGAQYIGDAVHTNEPLRAGIGVTRIVLGFDRLLYYDTTLGVRVGWAVLGEGPTPREGTPFIPLLVSARVTHWLGDDLFKRTGLRPNVFVLAGYAMSDIAVRAHVREDPSKASHQGDNDLDQELTAWKRAGDAHAGAGVGLSFAWSTNRAAFAEVAVTAAFPFSAVVVAPSAGVMLGF